MRRFMRHQVVRHVVLALILLALHVRASRAQDQPNIEETTPERLKVHAQQIDVGDLWHLARHQGLTQSTEPPPEGAHDKRYLVITPSIGSKPSTGFNGGLSGNIAFYRGDQQ